MRDLTVEDFDQLIGNAVSLWRWEAQPAYHEPEEAEPFARWKAGEADDLEWLAGWLDYIGTATCEGRRFERVRKLADPPTEYQSWSLTIASANVEAGEDVRLIDERQADQLDLPSYDFVVVDDKIIARMNFGGDGFVGAVELDGDESLAQHRHWRDQAWQHAITVSSYKSRSS